MFDDRLVKREDYKGTFYFHQTCRLFGETSQAFIEIELTAHEFDLLYLLATNRGIVFSREALVQRVWGEDLHVTERSVDSLVKRVRRKIEVDPANPQFILTVWGAGYKFVG